MMSGACGAVSAYGLRGQWHQEAGLSNICSALERTQHKRRAISGLAACRILSWSRPSCWKEYGNFCDILRAFHMPQVAVHGPVQSRISEIDRPCSSETKVKVHTQPQTPPTPSLQAQGVKKPGQFCQHNPSRSASRAMLLITPRPLRGELGLDFLGFSRVYGVVEAWGFCLF